MQTPAVQDTPVCLWGLMLLPPCGASNRPRALYQQGLSDINNIRFMYFLCPLPVFPVSVINMWCTKVFWLIPKITRMLMMNVLDVGKWASSCCVPTRRLRFDLPFQACVLLHTEHVKSVHMTRTATSQHTWLGTSNTAPAARKEDITPTKKSQGQRKRFECNEVHSRDLLARLAWWVSVEGLTSLEFPCTHTSLRSVRSDQSSDVSVSLRLMRKVLRGILVIGSMQKFHLLNRISVHWEWQRLY